MARVGAWQGGNLRQTCYGRDAVTTAPDGPSVACGDSGSTPGLGGRVHLHLGAMLGMMLGTTLGT